MASYAALHAALHWSVQSRAFGGRADNLTPPRCQTTFTGLVCEIVLKVVEATFTLSYPLL